MWCVLYSFDGRRKRVGSKEKQVEERLQHRYKREMKGAIRDIKKDAQFLAAQKLQEQMQRSVSHMGLYMLAGVLSLGVSLLWRYFKSCETECPEYDIECNANQMFL